MLTSSGIILRHGSHFLLIQRNEYAKYWPLYWGFPGGKIEYNDSPLETAIRETEEEIGVKIYRESVHSSIHILAHYIDGDREHFLFLVENWEGSPINREPKNHKEIRWCTLDELPHPIIPHIEKGFFAMLVGETFLEYDGINS